MALHENVDHSNLESLVIWLLRSEHDRSANTIPPPTEFQLVRSVESPYPVNDRNNLSVHRGGGKGVLIAPHWVLTASHCITSSKPKAGDVKVKFTTLKRKSTTIRVDKIIRHMKKTRSSPFSSPCQKGKIDRPFCHFAKPLCEAMENCQLRRFP